MIASQELRRRLRRHSKQFTVTAARLAQFLESVEAEEVLLKQRLADREARAVWRVINGDHTSTGDQSQQRLERPTSAVRDNASVESGDNCQVVAMETYRQF